MEEKRQTIGGVRQQQQEQHPRERGCGKGGGGEGSCQRGRRHVFAVPFFLSLSLSLPRLFFGWLLLHQFEPSKKKEVLEMVGHISSNSQKLLTFSFSFIFDFSTTGSLCFPQSGLCFPLLFFLSPLFKQSGHWRCSAGAFLET